MPLPISGLRAALALGLTVAAVPALAQTTTITLDNATPPIVIPLKDLTSIVSRPRVDPGYNGLVQGLFGVEDHHVMNLLALVHDEEPAVAATA